MKKKTYNADDEQQVSEAQKKAEKLAFERAEAIRKLMDTKGGRSLIQHWLDFGDILGNNHVPGDPYSTSFNCGMANFGRMIFAEVEEASPQSVFLMRKEALENDRSDAA